MTAPQLTVYIQGQGVVSASGLNTFVQSTNLATDLRAFIGATGMEVLVRGTVTVDDGGAGSFYWNPSGTGPDDGVNIIVPPGAAVGCWIRLIETSGVVTNPQVVPSIAALRTLAVSAPLVGTTAYLEGYYNPGDGGGNRSFLVTNVNPGSDNGGTIIWSNTTGFYYTQIGPVSEITVEAFGAKYDGTADDTSAHIRAMQAVYDVGGGTVLLPPRTTMVSSVVFVWQESKTVNIRGSGDGYNTTIVKKITGTTTPVFDFSTTGFYNAPSDWSDFTIDGVGFLCDGMLVTNMANVTTHNLRIIHCDNGYHARGALLCDHYNPQWIANHVGYLARKSSTPQYCNQVSIWSGSINSNSNFGMDVGDSVGLRVHDTDMEANGTAANAGTGTIMLRNTISQGQAGTALTVLEGLWLENGLGRTIQAESFVSGLHNLVIRDCYAIGNENTELNIGSSVSYLEIDNVQSGSSASVWTIAAGNTSTIINSICGHLSDTTGSRQYTNFLIGATYFVQNGTSNSGAATLVAGAAAVVTPLSSGDNVFLTSQIEGGSPGWLRVQARTGTGFTIRSSDAGDTSQVAWLIVKAV